MDENVFTDLLVKASEAQCSLDRFKLLVKLMNLLKRKVRGRARQSAARAARLERRSRQQLRLARR
jgi:hypothetical protein